jgi:nucleotide-binding universal stress UspA family protein
METATAFHATAIVMATHGRTGLQHLLYGSVTEEVLARSEVPVFVVYARPADKAPRTFAPYTARVVVPQDGSANDAAALEAAVDLIGLRGEITLLTVVPVPRRVLRDENGRVLAYLDQQEERDRCEARRYLEEAATGLRNRPLPIKVNIDVRVGDPASGIAMAAIEGAADLIVMATHGRTGLKRALLGSVARTVLRTSPTPVVLVHPRTSETRGAAAEELSASFVTL